VQRHVEKAKAEYPELSGVIGALLEERKEERPFAS
jgi:hypothetical protein